MNSGFFLASALLRRQRIHAKPTHMSVATLPGAIAFTVMLCFAHSLLRALVSVPTAPLAAA